MATTDSPSQAGWTGTGSTRRSMLARVGGVALVATAIMVSKASPAHAAYPCRCCNLAYTRRCGVNWCLFNGDWLWYCTSGGRSCTCCEADWTHCSASNCC